jgi:uncharacterized LabA/DUF88 family protein
MVSSVNNENLAKLKILSDKICLMEKNLNDEDDKKKSFEEIKEIFKNETQKINLAKTKREMFNCYETIYNSIKIILNKHI